MIGRRTLLAGWGRMMLGVLPCVSGDRSVPFKANADRRHRIPKQRHCVANSAAYDMALRQRGSLTVWFTGAAIAAWKAEPRTTRGGQPRYLAVAITVALTLRAVFRLALRQTEGLISSIIALLGLDLAVPDHTTLSRRAETLKVVRPRPGSGPVHLLVDSTGLKLCGSGEWLLEKHGTKTRRSWRKLHIAVDADTGQIAAVSLTGVTPWNGQDSTVGGVNREHGHAAAASGSADMPRSSLNPSGPNALPAPQR